MSLCLFASDLHGSLERYEKLFGAIEARAPAAVFLGGDLLPHAHLAARPGGEGDAGFLLGYLGPSLRRLRDRRRESYPAVFVILGNDDPRREEASLLDPAVDGLWTYVHDRCVPFGEHRVYGYSYIPPSPFALKDWERYDVSRFVDPGCIPPEEGWRSVPVPADVPHRATIREDLARLAGDDPLERAIFLFHSPPYRSNLDRTALDGMMVDHAPLDVHTGSIAVRRFIEKRQPLVTMHGHIHESARLTGSWRDRFGRTHAFSAAHDGPELALVRFDTEDPGAADRELL
ncbi:MAG: metallophosphoesterase [Planctomycetota bacterium]